MSLYYYYLVIVVPCTNQLHFNMNFFEAQMYAKEKL